MVDFGCGMPGGSVGYVNSDYGGGAAAFCGLMCFFIGILSLIIFLIRMVMLAFWI